MALFKYSTTLRYKLYLSSLFICTLDKLNVEERLYFDIHRNMDLIRKDKTLFDYRGYCNFTRVGQNRRRE